MTKDQHREVVCVTLLLGFKDRSQSMKHHDWWTQLIHLHHTVYCSFEKYIKTSECQMQNPMMQKYKCNKQNELWFFRALLMQPKGYDSFPAEVTQSSSVWQRVKKMTNNTQFQAQKCKNWDTEATTVCIKYIKKKVHTLTTVHWAQQLMVRKEIV